MKAYWKRYITMVWTGFLLVIAGLSMKMNRRAVTPEQRERYLRNLATWRATYQAYDYKDFEES